MTRFLSYISAAIFMVFAVAFLLSANWWLFAVSLLFQVGIFLPDFVVRYRQAKKRKMEDGT